MKAFKDRITRLPTPHNVERGDEALSRLPELSGSLADLVQGAAGSSPHLADLMRREGDWLGEALLQPPENVFAELMAAPVENIARDLRQAKARVSLLIALADLGGVWSLEEVTGNLTRFADHAVQTALEDAIGAQIRRGKLPGQSDEDIAKAGGLTVLAMGKMGAFELNYSSDIDLICLFDETRFNPDDYADARVAFVKAVRKMCQTLSERTADGYVFRTDLRLRPDASVTPVAMSMEAAERYYESFGRTWERAAFIKARACAGDIDAGNAFLETLRPFVWRRHLDFAAIQDAQDMRLRIRDHKGLQQKISHLGHDLKLGMGGIREIEFFTQTRQLISGGRDADIRGSGTVQALGQLASKGWIDEADAAQLTNDYRAHREAEHRVQMVADQQTHDLPETAEEFAGLAALSGCDADEYGTEIETRLARVSKLTEGFFMPGAEGEDAGSIPDVIAHWTGYQAMRSPRAKEILKRVWPQLKARLDAASLPDEAMANFDSFLKGLPSGVQLFSLFEANPQLLDLVVDITDTAPGLGQYLARNARVFDAVIGGQFFSDWPGETVLRDDLIGQLGEEADYETKLDRARIWAREWNFRVGVHLLRGLIDAETSGRQYADVASAVVGALWPDVVRQFADKHGAPPGRGAAVLAMGSLGARRLNAASDLDLIVIFDGADVDSSDGTRPLATRSYYARLTQALVTALSAPTAEGRLYEVDMRLRPSGKQGPVATSLDAFRSYQSSEAWTWEHLALTRARALVGTASLAADIEAFRAELLARPRDASKVLGDAAEMRRRLNETKPLRHGLDVRAGAGRLQDVELLAQTGVLLAGRAVQGLRDQLVIACDALALGDDDCRTLEQAADLYWTVQAALRLIYGAGLPGDMGTGARAFLLRGTGYSTLEDLTSGLEQTAAKVAAIIDRVTTPT